MDDQGRSECTYSRPGGIIGGFGVCEVVMERGFAVMGKVNGVLLG